MSSLPCRAHSVIFHKFPIWNQKSWFMQFVTKFSWRNKWTFSANLFGQKSGLGQFFRCDLIIMKLGISQVTREEFVKAFLRWTEDDAHYTIIIFFTTKAIINIAIIINNVLNSSFSDRRVLPLYLSTRWKHKYLFLDEMKISCRWSWEMQIIKWMKM